METEKFKRKKFPQDQVGIISKLLFVWLVPLFYKGYKKNLDEDDLFETRKSHEARHRERHLDSLWKRELSYMKTGQTPSFLRALWKAFGFEIILLAVLYRTIELFCVLGQTWCLQKMLLYLSPGLTEQTKQDAILYGVGIMLVTWINSISTHNFRLWSSDLNAKVHVACSGLIFQKILLLDSEAFMKTSIGQIINLLANDISRISNSMFFMSSFFCVVLHGVVFSYQIFQSVGASSFIGLGFLICFIPVQVFIGKMAALIRSKTALLTDKRIQLMNEIIAGIGTIKMYAWEHPFALIVAATRRKEMRQLVKSNYLHGLIIVFATFISRVAVYLIIIVYLYFGNHITAAKLFTINIYYNIFRENFTIFLPLGMFHFGGAIVSIRRIQNFLLSCEVDQEILKINHNEDDIENVDFDQLLPKTHSSNNLSNKNKFATETNIENREIEHDENYAIQMNNVSFEYSANQKKVLENITCAISKGSLVAVIGRVGCGKSTLLNIILRENRAAEGSVSVNGIISYAQQDPWIFNSSIKKNILFGLEYDQKKYEQVVDCCSLQPDFQLLPSGDSTKVGEHGVKLSGGQKARISLARALYREADIYVLDDPFSAVDAQVGKFIFNKAIKEYLQGKTCVLVTHQLQFLKNVDQIIVLKDGIIFANGNLDTFQAKNINLENLFKIQNKNDVTNNEQLLELNNENCKSIIGSKSSGLNENTINDYKDNDGEHRDTGSVNYKCYIKYLHYGGNYLTLTFLILLMIFHRAFINIYDYFLSVWVNVEEQIIYTEVNITLPENIKNNWNLSSHQCEVISSALLVALIILVICTGVLYFHICMKSSTVAHDKMFNNIVKAKMHFFHVNPSGRILNRFSNDIGIIDDKIPFTLFEVTENFLGVVGIFVLIVFVDIWMLIPSLIVSVMFILTYKVYQLTSLSLKRLEATTQSSVLNTVSATLRGLKTIRVLKAESILTEEFNNNLNLHTSCYYLVLAISRALGFWLEIVTILYTIIVLFSLLLMKGTNNGIMGLVMVLCFVIMNTLQWLVREYGELENHMISFERILEYTNIPSEATNNFNINDSDDRNTINTAWPKHGTIEFINVNLQYTLGGALVLNNLNFQILPQEKVGIVGRTGAGKSSLIIALFRLVEPDGQVVIDGIDTKSVDLNFLRSKISIIPQTPVIFSATMRCNLDPFDQYSDEDIWGALEDVQLKKVVSSLPDGLNSLMSEGGSSLSIGQRQLVCLARAILKKNKILVLDEATANIDLKTDSLIQKTIREKFATCTVLTIAHRLHTVIDSDRILVMHKGTAAEFDHPFKLLQEPNSHFSQMVNKTSDSMAANLRKIAQKSYQKTIEKTS